MSGLTLTKDALAALRSWVYEGMYDYVVRYADYANPGIIVIDLEVAP